MKEAVIKKAIAMRSRALVPFSNYRVGAAVETQSGEIIGGCNVESSSYGLTCCAERVALWPRGTLHSGPWPLPPITAVCPAVPAAR